MGTLKGKRVLLIIGGGIAAYKALELIRRLKEDGASVQAILSSGGAQFITDLSVASLSGNVVYSDLFSLKDETEMGHIRLSREADVVVVAPASANLIAKMAQGIADDLATTTLLASNKSIFIAPSMNIEMWNKQATQRNLRILENDGIVILEPSSGDLACGEIGPGRMMSPEKIRETLREFFKIPKGPLAGLRAIVTAGPTFEPVDPIRYLANRSSGKQGFAIARALSFRAAETILVTGPTTLETPENVERINVQTAEEMWEAVKATLPVDIAICAAAVSDWRPQSVAPKKIKKNQKRNFDLVLERTPDILENLGKSGNLKPKLLVGFAAETENLYDAAKTKLQNKKAHWILANDISEPGVMGGDENRVVLFSESAVEPWERSTKTVVADRLADKIANYFQSEIQSL